MTDGSITENLPLSVVVIVLEGKESLERCLRSLVSQIKTVRGEILVPYDQRFLDVSSCRVTFPDFEFFELSGLRTFAELRAYGVKKSRGDIVAMTEDQCRPSKDWCQELLKAHMAPHAAVGGVVEKEVPDASINWAFFFADYLRYMSPMAEGVVHHLTDCNVSYKRLALSEIQEVWAKEFHEPDVHRALEDKGGTLWLTTRVQVYQHRDMDLSRALKDRFGFGRLFGSGRVENASIVQRCMSGAIALLTPPLTVSRIVVQVFQKGRWVKEFLYALPYIIIFNTCWAIGESVGCVTGRPPQWLTPSRSGTEECSQTKEDSTS